MSDPIRVLHFADTHVGMENYGKTDADTGLSSRVRDFLRRMDEMVAYARDNDVDLVIFAGDAFKTRNPAPTYQREFAYRVQDLAELAPVLLLVGNHDLPLNAQRASSIEIFDTLRVPNVRVAVDYALHRVETKRGPVAVGTAPYPIPAWLLQGQNTAGMTISEIDLTVQEVLAEKLDTLAYEADKLDMPRLLTGHFTVSGAVVGSERNIMLGRDVAVSLSMLADPRWDYVALGHVHKHQNLTRTREDAPAVVYSGSMERIDFGEEADPKGFCWVELARENTSWKYVQVAARPFVTIRADLRKSDSPTATLTKQMKSLKLDGAVVRVILQLTPEGEGAFNEASVRRVLTDQGVFYIAGISREVEQVARVRLGGSPEGMTPAELLERYLVTKEIPAPRRETLLNAARDIFAGED
jgi:DNA repair protein SbcD/Mre11